MTAEVDGRRDCLVFLEEEQRQVKKAALRTLLRTSPLLGTRLASLAPISFSFCTVYCGLVCFSYFSIGDDDLSAIWNCRLVSI